MDRTITTTIEAPAEVVTTALADLGTYDAWLPLVHQVEEAPAAADDPGTAYWVTLRAVIGPFARSKRLRMVRTASEAFEVRFERREVDGREHSPWEMHGRVEPTATGSRVEIRLHYGGRMWSRALDPVLDRSITHAGTALAEHLAAPG